MARKTSRRPASVEAVASTAVTHPSREFWIALGAIVIALLVLHAPSLWQPHFEGDEEIVTFLAERLREHPLHYTLQGELQGDAARRFIRDTWIHQYSSNDALERAEYRRRFEQLDRAEVLYVPDHVRDPSLSGRERNAYAPEIYDRPMFFHPPVYVYALSLFRWALASVGGPLLSILTHAAAVVLVALLGRHWADETVGILAASILAIDPVSWLCGSHLWIDGLLQLNTLVAVCAVVWAVGSSGLTRYAIAGVALGLAGLTKYTAVLALPAIVAVALLASERPTWRQIAVYTSAAAVVILPWLILSRIYGGAWLAQHDGPTPWLIEHDPYVRMTVNRPPHFFVTGLVLVAPIYLFCVPALVALRSRHAMLAAAAWGLSVLAIMTLLGVGGRAFQLRYLAPGMPALCLLAAFGIASMHGRWRTVLALVLAAATFYTSFHNPRVSDPYPFFVARYCEQAGWDFKGLFGRMWSGIW